MHNNVNKHLNNLIIEARKMEVGIYFYNYNSQLTNMGGIWSVFLNKNQTDENMYEDLKALLSGYVGMQKVKK